LASVGNKEKSQKNREGYRGIAGRGDIRSYPLGLLDDGQAITSAPNPAFRALRRHAMDSQILWSIVVIAAILLIVALLTR